MEEIKISAVINSHNEILHSDYSEQTVTRVGKLYKEPNK